MRKPCASASVIDTGEDLVVADRTLHTVVNSTTSGWKSGMYVATSGSRAEAEEAREERRDGALVHRSIDARRALAAAIAQPAARTIVAHRAREHAHRRPVEDRLSTTFSATDSSGQSLIDTPGVAPATFCQRAAAACPQPCGRLTRCAPSRR